MTDESPKRPAWGKIALIAFVVAALAAAWRYTPLSQFVMPERIAGAARTFRDLPWAPAALVLAYTPAAFVMFPRPLLTLFGVVAFGPWLGFAYSMAGIVAAALATYFVGRALPPDTVRRIAGRKLERMTQRLRDHGVLTMTAIRLVPAAPFAVEGIVAGAARIKVVAYTLGTVLGMTPGVLATSVFGAQIEAALDDVSKVNWWILGGAVVALALVTYGVGRWAARQANASATDDRPHASAP